MFSEHSSRSSAPRNDPLDHYPGSSARPMRIGVLICSDNGGTALKLLVIEMLRHQTARPIRCRQKSRFFKDSLQRRSVHHIQGFCACAHIIAYAFQIAGGLKGLTRELPPPPTCAGYASDPITAIVLILVLSRGKAGTALWNPIRWSGRWFLLRDSCLA